MTDEPLADVTTFGLRADPQYARLELPGALPVCLVRQSAAERLARAQESLPDGLRLLVWDGWRPQTVQQALWDLETARQRALHPAASLAEIARLTGAFVAAPSGPFPHGTGGAVDLTLCDDAGRALSLGTGFDAFGPACALDYYSTLSPLLLGPEVFCARNRHLLADMLRGAGFIPYPPEWWHWEYGTARWASATGEAAIYGTAR